MNAISSTAPSAAVDYLGSMRSSMNAVEAIGQPTSVAAANDVLDQGNNYLRGAQQTLEGLDNQIETRRERLSSMDPSSSAAAAEQNQLELLRMLQERIQLSMERVSDILAGKDRPDAGYVGSSSSVVTDRDQQLALLESKRQILQSHASASFVPSGQMAAAGWNRANS